MNQRTSVLKICTLLGLAFVLGCSSSKKKLESLEPTSGLVDEDAQKAARAKADEERRKAKRAVGPSVLVERLEASVNSSLILRSDLKNFRHTMRLRSQMDPLFPGTPVAIHGPAASDYDIVSYLIDERLIMQHFPKTDADVEQEINTVQSNNRLDRDVLKATLSREGYTFPDYYELIRESGSKRDLIEREIRARVTITDDDIKNYFYNHYAKNSEVPRAFHIELFAASNKSYPGNAKKIALQALKDIRSGEPFEEIVKQKSDGPSASTGGDLGVLTEDQMAPLIRQHLKGMKIGQVSEVFSNDTNDQFFIVRLVDVQSSENDRLEKMKDEIRAQLSTTEYQHQITLWLDRQKQTAFIHRAGESLEKKLTSTD